jgi:tetratricopeptide (TPR) repeat protein
MPERPPRLFDAYLQHAKYYIGVLGDAEQQYIDTDQMSRHGRLTFEEDWPNIASALEWSAKNASQNHNAAELCSKFQLTGPNLLQLRPPGERITWLQAAAQAAISLKDESAQAKHLHALADIYLDLGASGQETQCHERLLELSRMRRDGRAIAASLRVLGDAYLKTNDTHTAIRHFTESLAITRDLGATRDEGDLLSQLGKAHFAGRDYEKAVELFAEALAAARRISHHRFEAEALFNIAKAQYGLGNKGAARDNAAAAVAIYRQMFSSEASTVELQLNAWQREMHYSCFISYSTKDQDFAERLHSDLDKNGIRCWFAPHDIQAGKKLHEQIDAAIRTHDRLLLILSEHSMNSRWVGTEIGRARQRESDENRRVLFPLAIVPYQRIRTWSLFDPDTGDDSAREIRGYFVPDFSNWRDTPAYEEAFQRLVRDLQAEEAS